MKLNQKVNVTLNYAEMWLTSQGDQVKSVM